MADIAIMPPFALKAQITSPTSEKPLARWFLMAAAFIFLGVFRPGSGKRWPTPTRCLRSG